MLSCAPLSIPLLFPRVRMIQPALPVSLFVGFLAVAVAEMAFAGGLGARVDASKVPHDASATDTTIQLFSESNTRFLVEVPVESAAEFESLLSGIPLAHIGDVTDSTELQVTAGDGNDVINSSLAELKEAWQSPLRWH